MANVKEAPKETPQRKRILVVDDDSRIRSALGRMLTRAGHEVILAADGDEATRLCREIEVDLVILDLFMPQKDGIETIAELLAYNPGLPIIAMSGGGPRNQVDVLEAAKVLGAVATIEKPFEEQAMMELVTRSLVGAP